MRVCYGSVACFKQDFPVDQPGVGLSVVTVVVRL